MTESLHSAVAGILTVLGLVGWFAGKRPDADDPDTVEAHTFVLDTLSDADAVRTIDCITDSNLRDQLSLGEAMELYEEVELARFGQKRN